MALLIQPKHHAAFLKVLQDTFRLRRKVFVEQLKWALPTRGDEETDQFDMNRASYLVTLGARGQVLAMVRILPSQEPNLSCDVLGPQMGVEMPRGPHIVEMTRLCADPDLTQEDRRAAMLDLRQSIAALCLKRGWTHTVGVGYDHHLQPFIRSGMSVQVLGAPFIFPDDQHLSFAILAHDPDRARRVASGPDCLQDPDEDPGLLIRYGDRQTAAAA